MRAGAGEGGGRDGVAGGFMAEQWRREALIRRLYQIADKTDEMLMLSAEGGGGLGGGVGDGADVAAAAAAAASQLRQTDQMMDGGGDREGVEGIDGSPPPHEEDAAFLSSVEPEKRILMDVLACAKSAEAAAERMPDQGIPGQQQVWPKF
jgi:hypothetical protein